MKRLDSGKRKRALGTLLCVALLCAGFAALLLRAPYGLDWTDEAYYTALPYRFALGDRPLVDTWEVHQFSGLIALPFLRAYLLFNHASMDGCMLYFRYVLVCVQFFIALYGYFVLRRKRGNLAAVSAAGLMLLHVHYGLNGFSYNAMAPLFCMLSALLTFDAPDGLRGPLKAALSGAVYALAVQAYPYFALSVPVYVVFWVVCIRRRRGTPEHARLSRLARWFCLGVLAVAAAFCIWLIARAGVSGIVAGVRGMLGDPDHTGENAFIVLAQYANALRVLMGPAFVGAGALLIWSVAACYWKNAVQRTRMRRLGLCACLALMLCAVVWVLCYDYPNHHKINLAAACLTLFAPALYFLSGRRRDASLLLILLGAALSLAVQLGSNTRIRSSSGMLLPASIGTLLYLFDCLEGGFGGAAAKRWVRAAAGTVCACQVLLTGGLRMVTVYRDAPLPTLTAAIDRGPAKGVVTTVENVRAYNAVYDDLTTHASSGAPLLVTNLLPVAYLMTDAPPAAPSTFNMTMDAAWLARYYAQNPGRVPACIYAVDASIGQGNELSLLGADSLFACTGAHYAQTRLSAGTLFTRLDASPASNAP